MSEVFNNIEKLRIERGITQEQIADVLSISRATYINIKNDKRDLTISELEKLSAYFDIPVVELFEQP